MPDSDRSHVQKSPAKITPMLGQYLQIKSEHPGALLLFRMGDFYETFFEDARTLAEIAGVALTSRDAKSEHPVPLAGVPHHALDTYLTRLLEAGLTVAICDQVEDPAEAKGLVRRAVVQVVSPGTATSPELLPGATGRFCLAWEPTAQGPPGWALVDASTGEFRCGREDTTLPSLCRRHPVREVIVREDTDQAELRAWRERLPGVVINPVSRAWFHPQFARQTLLEHFRLAALTAFGLDHDQDGPAVSCAGALLRYLAALAMKRPDQITSLQCQRPDQGLVLDEETLRNLEIFQTFRGDRGSGTLVHHVDGTVTPMGRRLLEMRLARPLTDLEELGAWHAGVDSALAQRPWRQDLRESLRSCGDLARLGARAAGGTIGPGSLRQLGLTLQVLAMLRGRETPASLAGHPVAQWLRSLPDLDELAARILTTLVDEPAASPRKGGFIRPGVDLELDAARAASRDSKGFLAGLQSREREASGIPTLKVGYNKVFGYYFEVTNKHLDRVPGHYQQRQTLVNACRYHTEELKQAERTILGAEETGQRREGEIFAEILRAVGSRLAELQQAARVLADVDLMLGFAEIADRHRYCRPLVDDSRDLHITAGRHPVIEQLLAGDFIPNDTVIDGDSRQVLLLTGPNMGGKSTYLRQIALIALLAQAGSFVPARAARLGVSDRIFTRVGASDNLARGESTFFVEMSETAHILHQMTARSLVILDEIGRGTSTYDGLSLAWAITEHLASPAGPRPRSVFATHYHELTDLEGDLPGMINLCLQVREWEGRIIFLHAVGPGRGDKSYGIHVARLAGLPEPVLLRAQRILDSLSASDLRDHQARAPRLAQGAVADGLVSPPASPAQLDLFGQGERDALKALKAMDLESISPMDAFMWLARIKRQLGP